MLSGTKITLYMNFYENHIRVIGGMSSFSNHRVNSEIRGKRYKGVDCTIKKYISNLLLSILYTVILLY